MSACNRAQIGSTTCWSAAKTTRAVKLMTRTNASTDLKHGHAGSSPDVRARNAPLVWSVLDTVDYAGFIGRDRGKNNIYVAMGDLGQGLTHGVVGAMLNAALILGEDHPWQKLYDPNPHSAEGSEEFCHGERYRS